MGAMMGMPGMPMMGGEMGPGRPSNPSGAGVADMAMGLGTSAEALAPMLDMLERKGRIRKLPEGSSCGSKSCCKCDPATVALYEWAGSEAVQTPIEIHRSR